MAKVQQPAVPIDSMTSRKPSKPRPSEAELQWRLLRDRLQALEAWVIANDVMMKAIYAAYPGSSEILDEL